MKILHILPSYEPAWHLGGVVRSVSQLCRELGRLGHEVTVFTTDSGRNQRMEIPVNQPVEVGGVTVYYFKTDFCLKFCYSEALRNACYFQIEKFDIVHLASFWNYPGIPGAKTAKQKTIPYVISPRGSLVPYALSAKRFKKWAYMQLVVKRFIRHAAALHFTAELEREQSVKLGVQVPSFVVPNGLNIYEFNNLMGKDDAKEVWGLTDSWPIVLYLGRLHQRKGLEALIKAFAASSELFPQGRLLLAGPDDGQQNALMELARDLGIINKVMFPGYVPPQKRNSLLMTADLFSLVTYPGENFGNAAVEAMLAGVPVLLSEHVGICQEVSTDGAGVVVPLDVETIADTLVSLLADTRKLRTMGEAAAVSSRKRYNIHLVAKQMVNAYEDIINGRNSPELSWADR